MGVDASKFIPTVLTHGTGNGNLPCKITLMLKFSWVLYNVACLTDYQIWIDSLLSSDVA
jgi:hypothetical protein